MKTLIIIGALIVAMFVNAGAAYFVATPFLHFGVTPLAFVLAGAVTGPLATLGLVILWTIAKQWVES